MTTLRHTLLAPAILGVSAFTAHAQTFVDVSWCNFQEERWKTDEKATSDVDSLILYISSALPAVQVVAP